MSKIKYFKNFILCGDLNYRCLLCKENCTDTNVEKHLRWENHRKALKTQNCLSQFSKDAIYKVDPYYYCSFCNITVKDIAEIKQHIDSDTHKKHKSNPVSATTRVPVKLVDDIIYINNTPISHMQWNGVIDKHCVLCNVAVKNLSSHIYGQDHTMKLIQARVNCVDDTYYRKTDKHTFQCFACKKTFSTYKFDSHFMNHSNNNSMNAAKTTNGNMDFKKEVPIITDKEGNKLKGCTMSESNGEYPTVVCGTGMEKICKTEWDIQLLDGIEDDFFEIDMIAKKVTCKECKEEIKIIACEISSHLYSHGYYQISHSRVYKTLSNYIDTNYIQWNFDHGAARSKTAHYGNMNYIKMNAGGSKGYCTLCDKFLSASIEVFKVHVSGGYHKGHLELKGIEKPRKHDRGSYKPVFMMELIKCLMYSADKMEFLINGNFLISEDSFFLMKRIEHGKYYKKTKCFACDEAILPEDEKEHCISWKHKSNLLAAKTISLEKQANHQVFMREIRPRLYHCGVCNETLPYWETLQRHCKQMSHKLKYMSSVTEVKKFSFMKQIVLKTNNDNLYMQLLNAVFNTKYVIKLEP